MLRKYVQYPLEPLLEEYSEYFKDCALINVTLYIDEKGLKDIMPFLNNNRKKFRKILYEILQGRYNNSLYRKVEVSDKAKDVTEMKFSGKPNTRIYCKEFKPDSGKKIVMITLLANKDFQTAQNKSLKPKLESIGGYEYEF